MLRMLPIEKTLTDIWKRILDVEEVNIHDNFFHLGGDSITAAEMMLSIQRILGRSLSLAVLHQQPTIAGLAKIMREPHSVLPSSLVELQPCGDRPPFFCVHPVGGEVLCYTNLADRFGPDQPFYGIRVTNLPSAGEPVRSIRDLALRYVEEVRAFQPRGPYFLGGYSFGGSVALEMAQEMHAQGQQVALLAIFDHTLPPTRYRWAMSRPSFLLEFARNLPDWIVDDLLHYGLAGVLHRMGLRARAATLRTTRWIKRSGARLAAPEVEMLFDLNRISREFQILLDIHYRALRNYRPRAYSGSVVLFRARTRPLLRLYGDDLGWRNIAGDRLKILMVPGNHETILKEPHVKYLARQLEACLREAQRQSIANGDQTIHANIRALAS